MCIYEKERKREVHLLIDRLIYIDIYKNCTHFFFCPLRLYPETMTM